MVAALCEEVKDPGRSVPKAMGECASDHSGDPPWSSIQSSAFMIKLKSVLSVAAAAVTGVVYLVSSDTQLFSPFATQGGLGVSCSTDTTFSFLSTLSCPISRRFSL